MLLRPSYPRRKAATMVETALVFTAFMMLIVGSIDLGVAVFRYHVLSDAARIGVRKAIVHGSNASSSWNGGPWGTTTYGPKAANDSDVKAQAIAPYLVGMDTSKVNVTISWPDGSNAPEKKVTVTLSTTWTPILGFIFGSPTYTLSASSTMLIAH
jgi:Flp pilus assembly protein TadG